MSKETLNKISKSINEHERFSEVAESLLDLFPSSRIFATSGFLVDAFHNEEEHDYDPSIFGPTIKNLKKKIKKRFESATFNSDENCLHFRKNQKSVDLHILAPKQIKPLDNVDVYSNRYLFQLESNFPFHSYIKECSHSDKITYTAGNIFAEYGNSNVFCFNDQNLKDLRDKKLCVPEADRLRFSSDTIFRSIKNVCTGFRFEKKTYKYLIKNNRFDYIVWSDKKVEKDIISLLEDKFLSTLHRIAKENFLSGEDKGDFSKFIYFSEKSGILQSLFGVTCNKIKKNYDSKENVLLHLFESQQHVTDKFQGNYLFENFYNI